MSHNYWNQFYGDYWDLFHEVLQDRYANEIFKKHYDTLTLEEKMIIDKKMEEDMQKW